VPAPAGRFSPGVAWPPTVAISEPRAKVHFVHRSGETTVTVRLETLDEAEYARVHAPAAACVDDRTLPVELREAGETVVIESLGDDDTITVTAVRGNLERVVAEYRE